MENNLLGKGHPFQMSLFTFSICSNAIIAEPVSAGTGFALILGYVTTRRTRAVIVMNANCRRFLDFIDRIKRGYCWHYGSPCKRFLELPRFGPCTFSGKVMIVPLQPFRNTTVMRARTATAVTETVASVTALCGCAFRRCRAVFRALYGFALTVNVGTVIGAFRLRLLLLWCWLSGLLLWGLRGQRSEQYRCERKDGNESAHEYHR